MPPADPRAETLLELRAVSKYYGEVAALEGVVFKVRPGESVLVFGPNGAGKTTLLRTLASLARPSAGQVLFAGLEFHKVSAIAKAAIGFLSHATFLYPDLTARENLTFAGKLFGLAELDRKVQAALERFGVTDRASTPVRELSRGLQQRVALARAVLHDPQFLLLDEPFTGLDTRSSATLQEFLAGLRTVGKALVFSTHDFAQGARLAGRLVALARGAVQYDGPMANAPLSRLGIGGHA
jgi:heme ABC exporter ATP-binding subunit CcmA